MRIQDRPAWQHDKVPHLVVLVLFFFSGASGLVYEIAWQKHLVVVFGNTMLATSTVLSAFMAGLAAGSYVLGRYADKRPNRLLRIYALLQAGIGVIALAVPLLIRAVTPLYVELYGFFEGNMLAVNLIRFSICFCVISVPAFLMGGTLPVLSKLFSKSPSSLGHDVGVLYSLNTAGGLVGCLACGFLLLQTFGISSTTHIAIAVNLLTAVIAWTMAGKPSEETARVQALNRKKQPKESYYDKYGPNARILVGMGVFLSGFCALAYEVFWARMLTIMMSTTVYSFTIMLSIFLGGIALGSFGYSRFLARSRRQVLLFVVIEVSIGLFAYVTPYTLRLALVAPEWWLSIPLISAALMTVPTILMGAALPCAVQICQGGRQLEGVSVGRVYAANTLGAIFGPFAAGFVLIPYLGIQKGLLLVAALNLLAGLIALFSYGLSRMRHTIHSVAYISIVVLAFALAPSTLFRRLYEMKLPTAELTFYKEGTLANVIVYDRPRRGCKDFFLNSTEEASTRLWHIQLFRMLGTLPVVAHENPDDALMIAFGAGMSAGACVNLTTNLDCVELNPDIREVAEIFKRENLNVINNPKLRIIINDGRNHLMLNRRKYSLIIADATNPISYDAWTIYTREFYELCKSRLKPGGVFCQWVPTYLPGDGIKTVLNTFRSVFPHASFWTIYGSDQSLMLATPGRLSMDYEDLSRRMPSVLELSGLAECGVDTLDKFLSFFLIGEDQLGEILEGFDKINTDDLPHTQFRFDVDEESQSNTLDLFRHQESITSYMTNVSYESGQLRDRLRSYFSLSRMLNVGLLFHDGMEFSKARLMTSEGGLGDDENVKCMLLFDKVRKGYFVEWVADHPEDSAAHHALGYIYWREGNYEMAAKEADSAITLDSGFVRAHLLRAYIHIERGMLDRAAGTFSEVRRLKPTQSTLDVCDSWMKVIDLLRKDGHEPRERRLNVRLAQAFMDVGWLESAFEALRSSSSDGREEEEVLVALAKFYESMDLSKEALEEYRKLSEMLPDSYELASRIKDLADIEENEEKWRRWTLEKIPIGVSREDKRR